MFNDRAAAACRAPRIAANRVRHAGIAPLLHLTKLAVGVRDIAHLHALQAERAVQSPPLRHRTRNFPRRAAEVLDGGSIYWVVQGATLIRQRVLDIVEDRWDDGAACAGLILDPILVPLAGRATRPFQGWRYLLPEAAPHDLMDLPQADGEAALPPPLRAALRDLALL
jgi:hypothetical protein